MEKIQIFRFAVLQVKRNRKESCVFIHNCLEIYMCCGKAGDTTSIFSSQMQWHKPESLPHNIFSYLPFCDFHFGHIHLTKGSSYVTALAW